MVTEKFDFLFHLVAHKNPNDDDPRGQFDENSTVTHFHLGPVAALECTNSSSNPLQSCTEKQQVPRAIYFGLLTFSDHGSVARLSPSSSGNSTMIRRC